MSDLFTCACLWTTCDLSHQLYDYPSTNGANYLFNKTGPSATWGLVMMGDDDLDILTDIHEWIERDDIVEIAEDLDIEDEDSATGFLTHH